LGIHHASERRAGLGLAIRTNELTDRYGIVRRDDPEAPRDGVDVLREPIDQLFIA
jgi:hypothetical protein